MVKKVVSLFLVAVMLCGCASVPAENTTLYTVSQIRVAGGLELPAWVTERLHGGESQEGEQGEHGSLPIDTYYDNTASMFGYGVMSSQAGEDGFSMSHLITALREVNSMWDGNAGYEASNYILESGQDGTLRWVEKGENYIWTHYNGEKDNFYTGRTGNYGSLPMRDEEKAGPMAMLLYDTQSADGSTIRAKLNTDAINVMMTDLEEQGLNNVAFFNAIHNQILSKGGYAVCILAVKCRFQGETYRPNPHELSSDVLTKTIDGSRPLYLVMTGPDEQLGYYVEDLLDNLYAQNDLMGENFQLVYFQPGIGYVNFARGDTGAYERQKTVLQEQLETEVWFPESVEDARKFDNCNWDQSVFSRLLSLQQQTGNSAGAAVNLFQVDDYKQAEGIYAFTYQAVQGGTQTADRFVLNCYLSIPDQEASGLKTDLHVVPVVENDNIYATRFWYTAAGAAETGQEDEREEQEPAGRTPAGRPAVTAAPTPTRRPSTVTSLPENGDEGEASQTRDGQEDVSETKGLFSWLKNLFGSGTETAAVSVPDLTWQTDINTEVALKNILNIETQTLYCQDGLLYTQDGEPLKEENLALTTTRTRVEEKQMAAALPDGPVLQIRVTGKAEDFKGSVTLFDLPVYVTHEADISLPDWVEAYNDADGSDWENTYRFAYSCQLLFEGEGDGAGIDPQEFREQNAVLLKDIVIVLTELPVPQAETN